MDRLKGENSSRVIASVLEILVMSMEITLPLFGKSDEKLIVDFPDGTHFSWLFMSVDISNDPLFLTLYSYAPILFSRYFSSCDPATERASSIY